MKAGRHPDRQKAVLEETDGIRNEIFDNGLDIVREQTWHTKRQKFYQETMAADGRASSDVRFLTPATYRKDDRVRIADPVRTGVKRLDTRR